MEIKKYFERIQYEGAVEPSYEVLSTLQQQHLLHVPFENLDIHNHIKIDLTNLFDKIVIRNRGGFCYELNGLFYELLSAFGFTVKMVSARVFNDTENYSPEFDHMALLAKINDENYLVDVGFGEFSLHPIAIALSKTSNDPRGIFKIEQFDDTYYVVKKMNSEGAFIPEYIFSEKERQIEEFYGMCNYHQTDSRSHFMKKRICTLPVNNGRITLTGNTLKITENSKVTERQLNTEDEVQEVLWNYFRIKL